MEAVNRDWLPLAATALAGSAACAYAMYHLKKRAPKSMPPSPPPLNWLLGLGGSGHAPAFARPDLHRYLTEWASKLGGVYVLYIKGPFYVVTDPFLVNQVLSRGDMAMPKHEGIYRMLDGFLAFGLPQFFSSSDENGDLWRGYRKGLAPCFSLDSLKKSFPKVRACTEKMVSMWETQYFATGEAVPIDSWMSRATLDIIGHLFYNYDFNALDSEHNEFVEAMHENLVALSQSLSDPIGDILAKLFPTAKAKQSAARTERIKALFTAVYEAVKSRGDPPADDQSVGANIMRIKKPSTGEPFPEETVFATLCVLLIGGYDTTASTCMWALYDIARQPDVQKRIAQELAGAGLLQVPGQAPARQLEWADLAAFPYFNAVLKESMRLHTTAATGTVRVCPKNAMLGGWQIPKGSVVWLPFHAMHNSIHNFSAPEVFDPERWLGQLPTGGKPNPTPNTVHLHATATAANPPLAENKADSGPTHPSFATPHGDARVPPSKAMLPFSDGSRGCIGMNLAYVDARTILLSILSKFWLELDPSVGPHDKVEASQVMALVLTSGIPIKLRLKSHAPL
ncbi:cytochrome P450 [Dunaliella salina]|uniref:Cytochrome P450 n=1 Tax=Dunaliella salina TaxID=3046 RepID=A0ABQ7G918_DUNSA|nr:cytochrome P450 [Dunaliella salina]|eukprot:KAF5831099.1 cytochrome P450 [Dunaliella salina]